MAFSVTPFTLNRGDKTFQVSRHRADEAQVVDKNQDGKLCEVELTDYLQRSGDLRAEGDQARVMEEFKLSLQGAKPESFSSYKSYKQLVAQMDELVEKYPDKAQRVSLGQTHGGTDIWALKVSSNVTSESTKARPAVVVTGATHSREWATTLVPLGIAEETLANYDTDPAAKNRVDNGELWFVPVVTPDGYEFSRTENPWWRKNRAPQTVDPCGKPISGSIGVDVNRNYYDGKPEHAHYYRSANDSPCSTADDSRATSDDPREDTYRGPSGGSEKEVQAMLNLQLNRGNVKGVIDYHSYGDMILYPWGNEQKQPENLQQYLDVGNKMNAALKEGRPYALKQAVDLYPTTGGSIDTHQANGIFSMTMEIGRSFHPLPNQLTGVVNRGKTAGTVFIDEVLAMNGAGLTENLLA